MSVINVEFPEFLAENPESYCRFCCSDVELQSIFAKPKELCQRIVRLVEQLTNITLTEAEDSPSAICGACLRKLFEFNQFRQRCKLYSNEIRKRRLNSANNVILKIEDTSEQSDVVIQKVSPVKKTPKCEQKPLKQAKPRMQPKIAKNRASLMAKLYKSKRKNAKCAQQSPEEREFRCKICRQSFTDKESINLHMKKHVDAVNLKCRNCSATSETLQGLIQHAIQNYILASAFQCRRCGVQFEGRKEMIVHEFGCGRAGTDSD
ncbi:zinc finger protein 26-like [Culex pipiens pallens]|uniref:zinc finger protein 26-like n=1 Tax=Culex pipiens pallens TaxID=42434 RepID=UPI001954FE6B|nr:zinc finger protein 26-like [Culex pipiens pallens]